MINTTQNGEFTPKKPTSGAKGDAIDGHMTKIGSSVAMLMTGHRWRRENGDVHDSGCCEWLVNVTDTLTSLFYAIPCTASYQPPIPSK